MKILTMRIKDMSFGQLFMVLGQVHCKILTPGDSESCSVIIRTGLIRDYNEIPDREYPVLEYKQLPVFIEDTNESD